MNFRKIIMLLLLCTSLMNFQCDDDAPIAYEQNCSDDNLISDNTAFNNTESNFYSLIDAIIDGDCITISFSSSGCSGETWNLKLIDSEAVIESFPPQRNLKVVLENDEACLAVFTQQRAFDITSLRIEGANEVILNIEGLEQSLRYSY